MIDYNNNPNFLNLSKDLINLYDESAKLKIEPDKFFRIISYASRISFLNKDFAHSKYCYNFLIKNNQFWILNHIDRKNLLFLNLDFPANFDDLISVYLKN